MDLQARIAAGFARLVTAINAVDAKVTAAGAWSTVMKVTDENRSSANTGATMTVDAVLKRTLQPGQYRIRGSVDLQTANATMDYKYDFNFTGTATWKLVKRWHTTAGVAAGTDAETFTIASGAVAATSVTATTSGFASIIFEIILVVTVAGEFQFRWAQNTADAGLLTCLEGSYLEHATC